MALTVLLSLFLTNSRTHRGTWKGTYDQNKTRKS